MTCVIICMTFNRSSARIFFHSLTLPLPMVPVTIAKIWVPPIFLLGITGSKNGQQAALGQSIVSTSV